MLWTVSAYVNCDRDSFGGFQPEHVLAGDDDLVFEVKAYDVAQAMSEMWTVGNRMGCDINGKEWPSDVRSLSVGDLLRVQPSDSGVNDYRVSFYAAAGVGFDEVPEPTNRIVPITGQDRVTSR